MADTSDQHLARLHRRLAESREQVFELAQAMRGEQPEHSQSGRGAAIHSGFPHSRLMRVLMSKPAGVALGTLAVTASVLKPGLLLRALRMTPLLKPMFTRFVLPRLLRHR